MNDESSILIEKKIIDIVSKIESIFLGQLFLNFFANVSIILG